MTINKYKIIILIIALSILTILLLLYFNTLKLNTSFLSGKKNPADIDGNGLVDNVDRDLFVTLYQNKDLKADFDGNGAIDTIDATEYINLWRTAQ